MKRMRFSIDSYKIIKDSPSFMVLELDIISDGVNHHGTEFLEEDIRSSIPDLYNKPINGIIKHGDFSDHAWTKEDEKKQLGLGTIPETNKIEIIKKDGKSFLRINAIIWKYLYPEASMILSRRKEVAVSIEINPLKIEKLSNGVIRIKEWTYEAITLLGRFVKPAIDGAMAKVVKYSDNESYFEDVILKYGIMINNIIPPSSILDSVKLSLGSEINSIDAIELLNKLNSKNLSYSDIVEIKKDLNSLPSEIKLSINGEKISNWLSKVTDEKEGGQSVDKVKEFLTNKFSEDVVYVSHDDNQVICLDYTSGSYVSFEYSKIEKCADGMEGEDQGATDGEDGEGEKEDGKEVEIEIKLSENGKEVFKLSNSDVFVETLSEGQTADFSATISLEKFSKILSDKQNEIKSVSEELTSLKDEKEELATKFSSNDEKYNALESEKNALEAEKLTLEEKILSYSSLETELTDLRNFKNSVEEKEKSEAINALYSTYKDFLSDEDVLSLNSISKEVNIKEFTKELYSIVTPKIQASLEILKASGTQDKDNGSEDNLKYTTIPLKQEDTKETKKGNSLLNRIKNI